MKPFPESRSQDRRDAVLPRGPRPLERPATSAAVLALGLCTAVLPVRAAPAADGAVRPPAVAGLFYPRDPAALAAAVDSYLASVPAEPAPGELKALICPHAGYPYSGPVAAHGFALLRGRHYDTMFVLGPSHYAYLAGASVSGAAAYRTPLGDVPISPRARTLGARAPFAIDPPCRVEQPSWAAEASRPIPARGAERADTWEHSVEVEVPFLQRTLGRFDLVPVVMGEVDPARAARALDAVIDDRSLIVVSSDLSHYHPYAEARRRDRRCVDAIAALDIPTMATQEACGRIPILTLLHLAREHGWQPRLLDLRNSGDTSGDKSRVVGYAAIAFFAPAQPAGAALSAPERRFLLRLARDSIRAAVNGVPGPAVAAAEMTPALIERRGVFVTLTRHGNLRGCIGNLGAELPLYRAVASNAQSAALHDPRFSPVTARELDGLDIEISVLTPPTPLAFTSPDDLLGKLRPAQDGVVLTIGAGMATYLPQVWEQLPDKVQFLDSLARKAGGDAGDWRAPGTRVAIYHVVSFSDATEHTADARR